MHRHLHWYLVLAIIASGITSAAALMPTNQVSPSLPAPPIVLIPQLSGDTSSWTLTAVGDIMLDRYVRTLTTKFGSDYPFASIHSELTGDIVVANLEGPFTSHPSVATDTHLVFTFHPKLAPSVKSNGITAVSLANNHTLNFGQTGLEQTRQTLTAAGLNFFGDPKNHSGFVQTQTINGRAVALIGYVGLFDGLDKIIADVQQAKKSGATVIVMTHGGTEYNLKFTARQQADYHQLIDAGADMVIGAHPHVVEPVEVYKGKLIAYSLGNFIFDQFFSTDTQVGLMLKITFDRQHTTYNIFPLDLTKSQPKVAQGALRQRLLDRLADTSVVSLAERDMIRQGQLTLVTP